MDNHLLSLIKTFALFFSLLRHVFYILKFIRTIFRKEFLHFDKIFVRFPRMPTYFKERVVSCQIKRKKIKSFHILLCKPA